MNIRKIRPALYKITGGNGPENWGWNQLSDVCDLMGFTPSQLFSQFGYLSSGSERGVLAITDSRQGYAEAPIVSLVEYESALQEGEQPDKAVEDWTKRCFVPAGWVEDVLISLDSDTLKRLEMLDQLESNIVFEINLKGYAIHRYSYGADEGSINDELIHRLKKPDGIRAFKLSVEGGFQTLFVRTSSYEVTTAIFGGGYEEKRRLLLDNAWLGAASEKVVPGNKAFFIRRLFVL